MRQRGGSFFGFRQCLGGVVRSRFVASFLVASLLVAPVVSRCVVARRSFLVSLRRFSLRRYSLLPSFLVASLLVARSSSTVRLSLLVDFLVARWSVCSVRVCSSLGPRLPFVYRCCSVRVCRVKGLEEYIPCFLWFDRIAEATTVEMSCVRNCCFSLLEWFSLGLLIFVLMHFSVSTNQK